MWTELLERYQTLVVGGLGFVGVILTLLINGWQTRNQRRAERRDERRTLRVALIEELKINRNALADNVDTVREDTRGTGGYAMPANSMDDAYRAFVHRIGLLSQAEVGKIMNAYLTLRTYDGWLRLVGVPPPVKRSAYCGSD